MREVITTLIDVPFARMFVLAGIVFLIIAVLGKVEGKIDPGNVGRIGATVLGIALMIVGIAMRYTEISEAALERATPQSQGTPAASTTPKPSAAPDAAKPATAPETASADKAAIRVVSATYGRHCNGKTGNATQQLAKACDGRQACDYAIEPVELENPPANCARDLAAEWKCGNAGTIYTAILPVGPDKNEKLHLACAG